jgi:hypothetical protein
LKTNKELAIRNAAFLALPPEQQRVAIAIDTIQQLWLQKFRAQPCIYFRTDSHRSQVKVNADLQKLLTNDETDSCAVCARGAVFASAVRLSDGVRVSRGVWDAAEFDLGVRFGPVDRAFSRKERQFFSQQQLDLMEEAFECQNMGSLSREKNFELFDPAPCFGVRFEYSKDRLMAIMQNVIDHNGTFDPRKKTRPLYLRTFFERYVKDSQCTTSTTTPASVAKR